MSAKCPSCGEKIWVPYQQSAGSTPPPPPPAEEDHPFDARPIPPPLPSKAAQQGQFPPLGDDEDEVFEEETFGFDDEPSPRSGSSRREVTCKACGFINEPGAQSCDDCGARLNRPSGRSRRRTEEETIADFEVGSTFSDAWAVYTDQMVPLLFGPLLLSLLVIPGAFMLAFAIACGGMSLVAGGGGGGGGALGAVLIIGGYLSFFGLFLLAQSTVMTGTCWAQFRALRGEQATIGDHFFTFSGGFSVTWRVIVLLMILTLGVILTCGLGALVIWPFAPLLVYRNCSVLEALSEGVELIGKHFGNVLLLGLAGMGVMILSGFVPLGQLFASPFVAMLHTVACLRMIDEPVVVPIK
ncbi:MAG: zinc ribbon domain-containing protein [Planctomycetaceae bacterium]